MLAYGGGRRHRANTRALQFKLMEEARRARESESRTRSMGDAERERMRTGEREKRARLSKAWTDL